MHILFWENRKDIAQGAVYSCSPAASWASGQILPINGGGVQELD